MKSTTAEAAAEQLPADAPHVRAAVPWTSAIFPLAELRLDVPVASGDGSAGADCDPAASWTR
jgi:hypothetical protein